MKESAVKLLKEESRRFEEKGYEWLFSYQYPFTFTREVDGKNYYFEVDILEKTDKYVHVAVMVSYDTKTDILPPGYNVHHLKALSDKGLDIPGNMRLMTKEGHGARHKYYRPWAKRRR